MAKKLHQAIFSKSRIDLFKTDWTEDDTHVPNERQVILNPQIPQTPFDYPPSEEMDPILWFEEYTVSSLWSGGYSSTILGNDRPPMAAAARDIISLISYLNVPLSPFMTSPDGTLFNLLKEFRTSLFSIPPPLSQSFDREWASRGLFADMFFIATANGRSTYGRDDLAPNAKGIWYFNRGELEVMTYPGSDSLRLGKVPVDTAALKDIWGTLDDLKASFIDSGPYKIQLSTDAEHHLTLSSQGKLRIFWEGPKFRHDTGLYPGQNTFRKFKYLTLGR